MKKWNLLLGTAVCSMSLLAGSTVFAAEADEVVSDDTVAGWHIVVEDAMVSNSMENVSVELGYIGVETSNFVKEAEEGKEFCLVKLLIEKQGSREVIDWENLTLKDENGSEYTRLEDEFIEDLGMKRMVGTKLNFGSNEGWIAFEIEEGAQELTLSYPFDEEEYSCTFAMDAAESEDMTEAETE